MSDKLIESLQHDPETVLSKMTPDAIGDLLARAADAYYNEGAPLVSDDLYDLVVDHLGKRNPDHPALERVGAPVQAGKKVELPYWMGSLDKIRDDPKALARWLSKYSDPPRYVQSDKLDGNSGLLVYNKGTPALYSRGDGTYGQTVSHLLGKIQGIPTKPAHPAQPAQLTPSSMAVRGELIISKANWEKIKTLGANARNVVAGAMHASSPDPRIAPHIEFVAYELLEPKASPLEGLRMLQQMGFRVVHHATLTPAEMSMDRLSEALVSRRKNSPYEVDGIVLAHDGEHRRVRGKNPKNAFAFKSLLTHDEAEVIVTKVEWNVSKDGYIKPLVHFPPVTLEGAKLSKATGFNAAYIEQNKIGPGSRILVIRSGAVIPHILRVLSPSSNGLPAFPDTPYLWTDTHVDIKLLPAAPGSAGTAAVPAEVMKKRMEYFVKTLDIKSVGPGTIERLYAAGATTIPKLLALRKEDLLRVDGFQATSAQNILNGLAAAASARCADLMAASGLFGRGMGVKKLTPVLAAFPRLAEMDAPVPSYQELLAVQGVGEASVKALLEGIGPFREFLKEINASCRAPGAPVAATRNGTPAPSSPAPAAPAVPASPASPALAGMNVVFTGFRNKGWENQIADAGGKVTTSVSKNTNLVVASDPDDHSTKLQKASDLGIPIMSREAFSRKYNLP